MSSDDEIDLKELSNSVKKYATQFFKWDYAYETLLLPIIYLTWWIRTRNLPLLQQKYLIGLDPYYYYRLAGQVLETGTYALFDTMRVFPFGKPSTFNFFPYFLAYWNKFLNIFGDYSLIYTTMLYNPVVTALSVIFFFLFLKNVFNKKVAVLSSFILMILPAYLFRTIAGFADHEALFMVLMFLSLWLFSELVIRRKMVSRILFALGSGFATFLAAITMSAIPLLTIPVAGFILMEMFWDKKSKKNFVAYLTWLLAYVTPLMIFRGIWAIRDISVLLPLFALASLGVYLIIQDKYNFRVPVGMASMALTGSIGIISLLVFRIISFSHLWATILSPAETTGRVADTISEIIGGTAVFKMFGWLLILALSGAVLAAYRGFEDEHKKVKWYIAIATAILLGTTLLTNNSNFFNVVLLGIFGVFLLSLYLIHKKLTPSKNKLILLPLLMLLITSYLTTTATRFLFFFAPLVAIFSSYFIFEVIDSKPSSRYRPPVVVGVLLFSGYVLTRVITNNIFKIIVLAVYVALLGTYFIKSVNLPYKTVVSIALIFLVAMLAYGDYQITARQAKGTGSSLPGQWNQVFTWMEANTPEGSGIAHWWDYGYWTQSVGNRASIADGGTHGEYMLYLLGRYGMTGQTREEALGYFKTHEINYLLFSREEIGKYWAFSHIGSNKDLDRESTIGTFGLQEEKEIRDGSRFIFGGHWRLDQDIVIDGKVFRKGNAAISSFSYLDDLSGGSVLFSDGAQTVEEPLECLVINGEKNIFEVNTTIGGCFVLIPVFNDQGQPTPNLGALYLSEKTKKGLFGRLYIQNEKIEGFEEVYNDNTPLGFYRNQIVGPIKVWELSYDEDIETNDLRRSISPEQEEGFR